MAHPPLFFDSSTVPRVVHDPVSGRPVFVATQRNGKPDDRVLVSASDPSSPSSWCPFCAGNEARTPPDVLRMPVDPGRPWHARIVPNAYPITTASMVDRTTGAATLTDARIAEGLHDVVIESPFHDRSIVDIDPAAWRDVWSMCHKRLEQIAGSTPFVWATIFKNSGPKAGASLEHVHSQLVAIDLVPPTVQTELEAVRRDAGMFPRLLDEAHRDGRVLATRDGVIALVPPAPRQPYEVWLVSEEACPHFHTATARQVDAVADLTRDLAGRYERLATGCQFNWWLHQAPLPAAGDDAVPAGWHWHLEIMPRLTELAGFEVGTGCHIATISAAESAKALKTAAQAS